ncbi:hypothetical protein [Psychroflexus tropicus]|uniref:hypothetical protein n=1 Tax=Psychroflexus tropicus TaxID=197345 RepID=UPI00036E6059|nr:hypothetical protein [Psychroflexus tropicus]
MKTLIKLNNVVVLLLILFTSCVKEKNEIKKDEVGNEILALEEASFYSLSNDDKVNMKLNDIKEKWERRFLEEENKKVDLAEFELIKSYDTLKDTYYYFLKAKDKKGLVSTGEFLEKDDEDLTFKINSK